MLGATVNADVLARRWPAEIGGAPSRFKWPRGRANPRVGLGFALKEAEAGRSRRTHRHDDAYSTRRRRLAEQPPTFAEGGKIHAGGGIPPTCSIAGAKSQGGILVAIGDP